MQRLKSVLALLLVAWAVQACSSHKSGGSIPEAPLPSDLALTPAKASQERHVPLVRIAFSGRVGGEVAQCGCSVNPKGGMDRRLNYIRQQRKLQNQGDLLVVDAGNALFPAENIDRGQVVRQKDRATWILKAHALMGVAAQNVGYLDVAAGLDFLKTQAASSGIKLVSTNLLHADGSPIFAPEARVTFPSGTEAVVLGLTEHPRFVDLGLRVQDPAEALKKALEHIPAGSLVIVLSDLGQMSDERIAQEVSRPLVWVGSRDLSSLENPVQKGSHVWVRPQIQGQQWGLLTVAWDSAGRGWYDPRSAQMYWDRWNALSSEDKKDVRDEFAEYIGGQPASKIIYNAELVNMSPEFDDDNELSKVQRQLGSINQ